MKKKEAIVVGAGPYGLSIAAYLQATDVEPYVIGRPMAFWKEQMPKRMLLRSHIEASNIAAPHQRLSLAAYQQMTGSQVTEPIPVEDFIAYGQWFQRQVAPILDTRRVRSIAHDGDVFALSLEDGERLLARSVVLALGIGLFAHRPPQFEHVPRELAPHSSDLGEPAQFRGKRVAVLGRGQSALEDAALLHESGAHVEILTRAAGLEYLAYPWKTKLLRKLTPGPLTRFSHMLIPPTDLGKFRTVRIIADPDKFRRLSPEAQTALAKVTTKPIGAYWLPTRLKDVPVRAGVRVERVDVVADGLKLALSDGSTTSVDRVVLGTGYSVDVSKYDILDESLRRAIRTSDDGYPVLTTGLQTSVNGLYMAGVVGEKTLGPTLRFVTGTCNAAPRVAAAISGKPVSKVLGKVAPISG